MGSRAKLFVGLWTAFFLFGGAAAFPEALAQPATGSKPPALPSAPPPSVQDLPGPDLLRADPGGLTAEQVGLRAAATSYSAQAAEQNLRGAAARVDQAWAAFLPRLTGTARYTRLSDFVPPNLSVGGGLVVTPAAPGTPNPPTFAAGAFSFPLVLDNYLLQASIVVPISDYFLRLVQGYTAATQAESAAHYDAMAARAKSAADGRASFYTWLRARGAEAVAIQALQDQKTHLSDAQNQFAVGNASRADVLRAETAVAAAELQLERAKNLTELTLEQVKIAVHAKEGESLTPGESLEGTMPPVSGNLQQLTGEALAARFEMKSMSANVEAAHKQATATRATAYPAVSAFGDGIYANPNPRRFPQTNEWFGTWDVGAQLVWSPNDVLLARGAASDAESRANNLEAQKNTLREGIQIEVLQALQGVREADFALDSTRRELASAGEAYRVARELFNNGRGTSTTLTDAETELTRARLDALNARVDARIARVRLEHALGRDGRMVQNVR